MPRRVPTKRVFASAIVMVLVFSVGSASAEYDPTAAGSFLTGTEPSPAPSPEPSPAAESGVTLPGGGGGNINNEVVVINTVDGRSAHRAGAGVALVTGDDAHNQNAAAATSSCSDCRTVAVAAQAVIIQRTDATTIAPRNFAIALNEGCVRCQTFAAAYQLVFTTDGLVRFSAGARERLAGMEGQLRAVASDEGLSFPDMEARLDAIVEEMWGVVTSELQAVGVQGFGRPAKDTDAATEDTAEPSPSPSPSESPSASPSASPAESPSSEDVGADDGPATGASPAPEETSSPAAEAEPSPSPG